MLGNKSPFSDEVLRHTEAQMDFVLRMYSTDNPDEFQITRPGEIKELTAAERAAAWENRLLGPAHDTYLRAMLPPEAVMKRIEAMTQASNVLHRAAKGPAEKPLDTSPPIPQGMPARVDLRGS